MNLLISPSSKFFLFLLTLLTGYHHSDAQVSPLKSYSISLENRRVQVNVILKNNDGYIYTGTNNGLYKFDGTKFYAINFKNKDYTDTVTALYQNSSGEYWVGFNSGRLANIINGELTYLNLEEGNPAVKITAFVSGKDGTTWFATNGEGVYYLKNKRLYLINAENGLSDENVSALALADNGDIIAATDQGIDCINIKNHTVSVIGPLQGLPDYIVTSVVNASANKFWIGMQDKGFCLYDHTTKKISIPQNVSWVYGQVNYLLQSNNNLWIATQNNGLLKYTIIANNLSQLQYTHEQTVSALLQDAQGNIWYSSPITGLSKTANAAIQIFPLPEGAVFDHIHALLADNNGNLWLTNSKNELIKTKLATNTSTIIKLAGINEKTDITALYQDANDNIWIGTLGRGVYLLDVNTNQYRVFNENPLLKNATVLSISGKENNVFASTLQGSMQVTISPSTKNIHTIFNYSNFDKAGVATNYTYAIFKDSKQRIWFATDGKGLFVMDKNSFTNYGDKDQIKDDRIYSITEDKAGNIWFSTSAAGIYKFDGKNFINYSVQQGLSDLNISSIRTDIQGNIVVVHKKGLDVLNPKTNKISYINNNAGINGLNVEDLGAVSQDTSGHIFVSSEQGIVLYKPETNILLQPKTIIESVQLFLKTLPADASHKFGYEDNSFTFEYTGLYYSDPEQVYYQYKLEGFDTTWIATKDRSKTFPKLAPGKYNFRIQSSLNKNFINADEANYAFTIRQAFYKEWWFIVLIILTLSALLFFYVKNREAGLKRMERLQQEKIQFRFEVLRNQVNPHFLFNSFNTLISTIEDDPKQAVEYVEQLSDFFRNIVHYRDKDVITLKEELGLLNTYYFLQKKRYGDNLQLAVQIDETSQLKNYVPPLTFQLLLENAIKHNAITKATPLVITVAVNGDENIVVSNNINVRLTNEPGSGMGLQNIINRYHLLTNKEVQINASVEKFIVSLPLIKIPHA
ncbi:MAG: two-component regulator propeller domain-containing protein [Ferruginibacter sp.]